MSGVYLKEKLIQTLFDKSDLSYVNYNYLIDAKIYIILYYNIITFS